MKRFIFAALLFIPTPAAALDCTPGTVESLTPACTGGVHQSQTQTQYQTQHQGQDQSQSVSVSQHADSGSVTVPAPAPGLFLGSLVAAPETCLGSVTAGGTASTGLISFGLGFGKTYESAACNRRMDFRSLMSAGTEYRQAALLVLTGMSVEAALRAMRLMPALTAACPDGFPAGDGGTCAKSRAYQR